MNLLRQLKLIIIQTQFRCEYKNLRINPKLYTNKESCEHTIKIK